MLFQNLHSGSTEFADRLTAFDSKVGEVIIPDEGVVQSVFAVVDFGIAKRMLGSGEFIFSAHSDKPMTLDNFRQACFYPALASMGIQPVPRHGEKPGRTPYSTRHTFATLMKSVKGADKDKAALMGHTSYEMTLHYQHEDYESLKKIICSIA